MIGQSKMNERLTDMILNGILQDAISVSPMSTIYYKHLILILMQLLYCMFFHWLMFIVKSTTTCKGSIMEC